MKLSTRSRYGVRLMFELALHHNQGILLLKDVAEKQQLSEKYLSQIIIPLKNAGLVNSVRGAHGGYALNRLPSEINLKMIVELLEGDICPVDCLKSSDSCNRTAECVTRKVWKKMQDMITDLLSNISLQDLINDWNKESSHNLNYQI